MPEQKPELTTTIVLGWNAVHWARAARFVASKHRLPEPTIAGAFHLQQLWRGYYETGHARDIHRLGDDLMGYHGWVYLMFVEAVIDAEKLQRFGKSPKS